MRTEKILFVLLFGTTVGASIAHGGAQQSSNPEDPLIAYWPLDTFADGKTEDQVNAIPLSLTQSEDLTLPAGWQGKAFPFNGAGRVLKYKTGEVPNRPLPLYPRDAWTISMWVKGEGKGQTDKRIFSEGSTESDSPLFTMGTDVSGQSNKLDLFLRDDNGATLLGHRQSETPVFDGEWHHIAWVDINGTARLYVDGVRDPTDFNHPNGQLSLNTLTVGGILRQDACCYFEGLIDAISLWDTALTEQQIAALAEGTSPPNLADSSPQPLTDYKPTQHSLRAQGPEANDFSLTAPIAGSPPMDFQWSKDGKPIPGATNRVLRWDTLQPEDSGRYSVDARNALGSATQVVVATLEIEKPYYRLKTISIPDDIALEVSGMDFMQDGRLMIATRRGNVWALKDDTWSRFAQGLDEPMGVCSTGPNEIVVAQRPELTRISDRDGDATADRYTTITAKWHYSGHMYEWAFGPVQDSQGNFWGTLAYWFFPPDRFLEPPYDEGEIPDLLRLSYINPPDGYAAHSEPQYRGWCFKVTPDGEFVPVSTGLRSPNGIGISPEGEVFVTDNQGEYVGTNPMHHVSPHAFHGYPTGLLWDDRISGDPTAVPLDHLKRYKKPAAVRFPYGTMGQSISQPVWDTTEGNFGPFQGDVFVGDQTRAMVMRTTLEKVQGVYQGACYPFRDGFQCGVNRLVFGPDGALYAGETDRGWGSVGTAPYGLQKLEWTGRTPFEIAEMSLTSSGFALDFTRPVDADIAEKPETYQITHYRYPYRRPYGADPTDRIETGPTNVEISPDQKTVTLTLDKLVAGKIYELRLSDNLTAEDGSGLRHAQAYYTVNRLRD